MEASKDVILMNRDEFKSFKCSDEFICQNSKHYQVLVDTFLVAVSGSGKKVF